MGQLLLEAHMDVGGAARQVAILDSLRAPELHMSLWQRDDNTHCRADDLLGVYTHRCFELSYAHTPLYSFLPE